MGKMDQTCPSAVNIHNSDRRSAEAEVTTSLQEWGKAPAAEKLVYLFEAHREESYTAT